MALCLTFSALAFGQLSVHLNLNSEPTSVRTTYYYLPDVEAYYDVHESRYIYFDGRAWIHSSRLPGRFSNYDMDRGRKVMVSNYRGRTPYTHFKDHRKMYRKGDWDNSNRGPERDEDRLNKHNNGNHGDRGNNGNHGNNEKSDRR